MFKLIGISMAATLLAFCVGCQSSPEVTWNTSKGVQIDRFLASLTSKRETPVFFAGKDIREYRNTRISMRAGRSSLSALLNRIASQSDLSWVQTNGAYLIYKRADDRVRFSRSSDAKGKIELRWPKRVELHGCCDWPIRLFITALHEKGVQIRLSSMMSPETGVFGQSSKGYIIPFNNGTISLPPGDLLDWLCNSAGLSYSVSNGIVELSEKGTGSQ